MLNEPIKCKRGITADAALDLAETLGTSARLWMNLQSTFDLAQAEKNAERRNRLTLGPLGFTPADQGIMRRLDSAIPVGHQALSDVTNLCVSV